MNVRILLIAILLCSLAVCGAWAFQQSKKGTTPKPKPAAALISFKKDVAPVITKYCLPCHSEDQMNPSELYLDSYGSLFAGGKNGRAFVAGNPDSSLLIRKISLKPPFGDPMPMKRKTPFPDDTLKILSQWILQGAKNN